ncbi:phage tail tape measure protein [Streptomyces sp. NPDC048577]|uniref:phage tail tape measure protein n=1 Tax=Streptomyces sp. NPDC048577 TaxID=3157209 RepID=UPI00342E40E5
MGTNQRRSLEAARTGSLALVAAFGFAVFTAAKFEKAMSNVAAVTQASAGEMARLRSAALEAGRTTAYSASQAAEAEFELAKAGISVADIAGGALKGSLSLAAAAQIDLSEAAEISATTMTVFGLKGKDVGHVADVLAAAANKSATDVHQLGLSFKMAGLVAAQTGLSLEDTTGTLALFAAQGMKGSDAGTSLKVMLQRLTPNSKEAQATMDQLGLSAYDATGQFVGLHELAGRMKKAFAGLTPEARNSAMGVIFGSDAVRAASILYKYGEEGVRQYTDAVNDQGYAAAVAAVKMDNLIGDLQLLKSALESALIESGSAANAALRDMVQWVTRLVNIYNGLPPGVQRVIGGLTGVVGVVGLVGTTMLLVAPRVLMLRRELVALGFTATRARASMATLGRASLVVAGLMAISYAAEEVRAKFSDGAPSVQKMSQAMLDFSRNGKTGGELAATFGDNLDKFSESVNRIAHPDWKARTTDVVNSITLGLTEGLGEAQIPLKEAREQLQSVDEALSGLVQSGAGNDAAKMFKEFAARANEGGTSTEKFLSLLPQYTDALASSDTQMKLTGVSQGQLSAALAIGADEMADQRSEAEKLADQLAQLNGSTISAAEAEIGFQDSLAGIKDAVKENGHSLNVTTEKGRAVKGAFLDAAKAAQEHARAVAEQTGSQEAGNSVLAVNIGLLRQTMGAAGFTTKEVDKLIGAYAQLPRYAETDVDAPGAAEATRQIDALYDAVADLQPGKTVVVKAPTGEAVRALQAAGYAVKTIPGSKDVRITAPTGAAQSSVSALKRALDSLKNRLVTVTTVHRTVESNSLGRAQRGEGNLSKYAGGGMVRRYSTGGRITGPGSSTSDSVPAMLSNGEYVIRAAAVRKYGPELLGNINAMSATGMLSATRFAASSPASTGPIHVDVAARVFVGDQEIRDIVRVEAHPLIRESEGRQAHRAKFGRAVN